MPQSPKHGKCDVTKTGFARWCEGMKGSLSKHRRHHRGARATGLYVSTTVNINTLKPSAFRVILRDGEFMENGIILNFCPFCGGNLRRRELAADKKAAQKAKLKAAQARRVADVR